MPSNYECTVCGTPYDYTLPTCSICGNSGHIIYTGKKDQAEQQARERAEEKRRQQRQQEAREAEKRRKNAAKKSTKSAPAKKSKKKWSWIAAIIAFLLGVGFAGNEWNLEGPPQFIVGGIAGVIFGLFYKQIIGFGVILIIIYAIANNSEKEEVNYSYSEPKDSAEKYAVCIYNDSGIDLNFAIDWGEACTVYTGSVKKTNSLICGVLEMSSSRLILNCNGLTTKPNILNLKAF